MDYLSLKREIVEAGLLKRQYGYYICKIFFTLGLLALSVFFIATIHNFAFQLLNAALLAFVFVQSGLIMHDADHHQIFKSKRKNEFVGLIGGNLIAGISSGIWTNRHNTHHSSPNDLDTDPDVNISVLAFSEEQALNKKGVARLIVKYQAYLWFPLLMIQPFRMRYNYLNAIWVDIAKKRSIFSFIEASLFISSIIFYLGLIFYFLNFWQAITFILVHNALTGLYMGTIFATNHKGMPLNNNKEKIDYMRIQIMTTRNVKSNPLTDLWCGGLNLQIEHHLFTNMPRNNLSKAQKIVKHFCKKHSIEYYETGFFQSYKEVLQNFYQVSAVLRRSKSVVSKHEAAQ